MPSEPSSSKQPWLFAALAPLVIVAGGTVLVLRHDDGSGVRPLGDPTSASSSLSPWSTSPSPSDEAPSNGALSTSGADDGEAWLFSFTARAGSLVEQPDGNYLLTLEQADEHVTGFTDRPDRNTAIIPVAALFEEWSNLFADSPPNAVLVEHDPVGATDSWVVELTDPKLVGSTATFTAKILDGEDLHEAGSEESAAASPPERFRTVSLFIDDVDTGSAANKSQFKPTKVA